MIAFRPEQNIIINTANARFNTQHGIILRAPMGFGKTLVALKIADNFKTEETQTQLTIRVFCPDNLQTVWRDDAKKLRISIKTTGFNGIVKYINAWVRRVGGLREFFIFDECHQLRTLINGMTIRESELVCKFFNRVSVRCLGVTGTLIFKNMDDLLYEINVISGLDNKQRWRVPFSWNHLVDVYPTKRPIKSFVQGWVATVWKVGFSAMTVAKLADIADFYLTQNMLYKTNKTKLVQSILRSIPGLDQNVLSTTEIADIRLANVMTIPTIILAYGMMSPFSSLIPTLFGIIDIEEQNDLKKLNMNKLCDHVKNLFVVAPDQGSVEQSKTLKKQIECALRVGAESANFGLDPIDACPTTTETKLLQYGREENSNTTINLTIESYVSKVRYTPQQLQAFIRFTTNRLTTTEAEKLGISRMMHTRKSVLTMEDLSTTGLRIGNMSFTDEEVGRIKKENDRRISMFWNSQESSGGLKTVAKDRDDKGAVALNAELLADLTPVFPDPHFAPTEEESKESKGSKGSNVPKFEKIIAIIKQHQRTVVYSQFVDDIMRFFEFDFEDVKSFLALSKEMMKAKEFTSYDADGAKRQFNACEGPCVLMLDAVFSEGFRDIRDVDAFIIMEPAQSSSMKQQIIARVARADSYTKNMTLKVYEFVCFAPRAKRLLASAKDWWKHDATVGYWVFKPVLDQLRTPDQFVKQQQNNMEETESAIVQCAGVQSSQQLKKMSE